MDGVNEVGERATWTFDSNTTCSTLRIRILSLMNGSSLIYEIMA